MRSFSVPCFMFALFVGASSLFAADCGTTRVGPDAIDGEGEIACFMQALKGCDRATLAVRDSGGASIAGLAIYPKKGDCRAVIRIELENSAEFAAGSIEGELIRQLNDRTIDCSIDEILAARGVRRASGVAAALAHPEAVKLMAPLLLKSLLNPEAIDSALSQGSCISYNVKGSGRTYTGAMMMEQEGENARGGDRLKKAHGPESDPAHYYLDEKKSATE